MKTANTKNNMPVMFLRSPKHFKAGKQFMNFYSKNYRLSNNIGVNTALINIFFLKKKSNATIYRFFKNYSYNILPDLNVERISIKTSIIVKF